MLASLTIHNIVLIEKLTIEFRVGLCALTGETGAGKSILLDSLGLALGARGDSGLVRKGQNQASVIAEFDLAQSHPVFEFLTSEGIEAESPLIFRRMMGADGKSRAFINDQPVGVGLLKSAGEMAVEIHGQFDTQTLLSPKTHRSLLDEYAGKPAEFSKLASLYAEWRQKEKEFIDARDRMHKARQEEDYLRGALEDLDALSPQEKEEDKLVALRDRLMKREQHLQNLNTAFSGLEEAETMLNAVYRALEKVGAEAAEMTAAMDRAQAELTEVHAQVQSFVSDLEESEYSLSEIDDRLFALKGQARKHGCAIDDLPQKREEIAQALNDIDNQDDSLGKLEQAVVKARAAYITQAEIISAMRIKTAQKLDKLVNAELPPLKLDKARFETAIEKLAEHEWNAAGMDGVQFLVATNPGAAAGPLNKIASGGEMARFMLALKVVLAEVGAAQTLIFDEVDSGIGGATADAVGERLAALAEKRQVLVVTHSPQVAARADNHWIVAKGGDKTITTNVMVLPDAAARREEIARMLSGATITEEARAAANKLLEKTAA